MSAATIRLRFSVEGLSCASCVGRAERALAALPGVRNASVNLAGETAQVDLAAPADARQVAAALDAAGYPARRRRVTLAVREMTCASCVGRVGRALEAVPGVLEAEVNLAAETATATILEGAASDADLVAAVAAAGYDADPAHRGEDAEPGARKAEEAGRQARRAALAGMLALPVVALEMGGHMVPALHALIAETIGQQASWLIQFVLTAAVLAWPGREFYLKGAPALLRGAPDMNSLVAVGTGGGLSLFGGGDLPAGASARGRCGPSITRPRR